jgi:hypothetical protein
LEILANTRMEQEHISAQQVAREPDPLDAFKFEGARIVGDITLPLYSDEEWEQFFQAKEAKFKAAMADLTRRSN